jgi:hypothetical protein
MQAVEEAVLGTTMHGTTAGVSGTTQKTPQAVPETPRGAPACPTCPKNIAALAMKQPPRKLSPRAQEYHRAIRDLDWHTHVPHALDLWKLLEQIELG